MQEAEEEGMRHFPLPISRIKIYKSSAEASASLPLPQECGEVSMVFVYADLTRYSVICVCQSVATARSGVLYATLLHGALPYALYMKERLPS